MQLQKGKQGLPLEDARGCLAWRRSCCLQELEQCGQRQWACLQGVWAWPACQAWAGMEQGLPRRRRQVQAVCWALAACWAWGPAALA